MPLITNEHVERLWQFQPFSPDFSQLYAEDINARASDELETKAKAFVAEIISKDTTQLVILTGDPGHGKTHLCGQLIRRLAPHDPDLDVGRILKERGDGRKEAAALETGKQLYIIKDLSDFDPREVAVERLVAALSDPKRVTVVCANEGKLRDVLSADLTNLANVQSALEYVLETGRTTQDEKIWIINLNHQSVAADGEKSLVIQALKNWVQDKRKWTSCEKCDAKPHCPIYENHRLLSAADDKGMSRRKALETLLRVAEKTDHVITIRDLLIFLAYTISGGLRCGDVHERVSRSRLNTGWQYNYLYSEAVFGGDLESIAKERLPVFRAMDLLDPGKRAIRPVDDHLNLAAIEEDGRFIPEMGSDLLSHQSKNQQRTIAKTKIELYRFFRRRDYFVSLAEPGNQISPSERLGFSHYKDFEKLLDERVPDTETVDIRNMVLCGLEAVQGVRRPPSHGSFAIVDPAFSSHRGNASVVAVQIAKNKVRLLSQTEWWALLSDSKPDMRDAVDWVDRRVHLVIPDVYNEKHAIELDCHQFEVVCRAGRGLVSRGFFQAEIRRITAQLAVVGTSTTASDEISVIVNGKMSSLIIDTGNVIVATGG